MVHLQIATIAASLSALVVVVTVSLRSLVHLYRTASSRTSADTTASADSGEEPSDALDISGASHLLRRSGRRSVAIAYALVAALLCAIALTFPYAILLPGNAAAGVAFILATTVAAFVATGLARRRLLSRHPVHASSLLRRLASPAGFHNLQYLGGGLLGCALIATLHSIFAVATMAVVGDEISDTETPPIVAVATFDHLLRSGWTLAYLVTLGMLVALSRWGFNNYWSSTLPMASDAERGDRRRHVLVLRGFERDRDVVETTSPWDRPLADVVWPTMRDPFERILGRVLTAHGPPVAISPPELAPGHGTHRERVPAEDWVAHVAVRATSARMIALVLGDSPGLVEELDLVTGDPDLARRAVFLLPPGTARSDLSPALLERLHTSEVPSPPPGRELVGLRLEDGRPRWIVDERFDEHTLIALFDAVAADVRQADVELERDDDRSGITFLLETPRVMGLVFAAPVFQHTYRLFVDGEWRAEFVPNEPTVVTMSPGRRRLGADMGGFVEYTRPLTRWGTDRRARRYRRIASKRSASSTKLGVHVDVEASRLTDVVVTLRYRLRRCTLRVGDATLTLRQFALDQALVHILSEDDDPNEDTEVERPASHPRRR